MTYRVRDKNRPVEHVGDVLAHQLPQRLDVLHGGPEILIFALKTWDKV